MTRLARRARIGMVPWLGITVLATVALGEEKPRAPDHEAQKAMPVVEQTRDCLACHTSEKDKAKLVETTRSCDANCMRCHKEMEKHHPVGPEVEETDKVSLPLLGDKKVACISCHDLRTAPNDTRSWKSQSLFARLFQGQATYKTYYLRINNSGGKLCKACH
jgi:hypothetical protein